MEVCSNAGVGLRDGRQGGRKEGRKESKTLLSLYQIQEKASTVSFLLNDKLALNSLRFKCQPLKQSFVSVPVGVPEVFEDFSAFVNEFAQAEAVAYISFEGYEVFPEFADLVCFEGGCRIAPCLAKNHRIEERTQDTVP
jgi:hypothetical protein